jgi:integrase/recombinase XerD
MKARSILLGTYLQLFFTEHLTAHKHASVQTIASLRDSFRLLLTFLQGRTGRQPAALRVSDLDAPAVLAFLDHLEKDRGNSIRSRNLRLSAIRGFLRLLALREPEYIELATRVLAIPVKRFERRLVRSLTREEIEAILAVPDRTCSRGRRDYALLLTMYNSGARVSEMVDLRRDQIHFGTSTYLELHGKGRKERTVPLWPDTARVLARWFMHASPADVAFPNSRGQKMTRDGVEYVLRQCVEKATANNPSLAARQISPHVIRHTCAMHLLQSGVDITVIALWLGHESTETTHVYMEADLATKERALEKVAPIGCKSVRFKPTDELMGFLSRL